MSKAKANNYPHSLPVAVKWLGQLGYKPRLELFNRRRLLPPFSSLFFSLISCSPFLPSFFNQSCLKNANMSRASMPGCSVALWSGQVTQTEIHGLMKGQNHFSRYQRGAMCGAQEAKVLLNNQRANALFNVVPHAGVDPSLAPSG